jgi:hypothetical protein
MAPNRITLGGAVRRGLLALAGCALAAAVLAGCGGSGGATTTAVPDKAADTEILDGVLSRQIGAVAAYERALPALRGRALASAREFHAQEQEHVDAIVKALRGLGSKATSEPEEIESSGLGTQAGSLAFLYEVESVSIAYELSAVSKLTAPWPRALLGSIAANQAQHLVVLRRALGAGADELIPKAFESGTTPAPGEPAGG